MGEVQNGGIAFRCLGMKKDYGVKCVQQIAFDPTGTLLT